MSIILDRELDTALINAILSLGDILDARTLLVQYRDKGFSQKSVESLLKQMKHESPEAIQDRIDELLDLVVGFCSPHLKIWQQQAVRLD
jgi:hypothetical protein